MKINNETIIKDDDTLIREKSSDVTLPLSKEDKDTLLALLKYVDDSTVEEIAKKEDLRPAVGIAAIQIGIKKKMIAVIIKTAKARRSMNMPSSIPRSSLIPLKKLIWEAVKDVLASRANMKAMSIVPEGSKSRLMIF